MVAAPTNSLHGLSPFDLKRERALELAAKKNFSDEREVLNAKYSNNSKRQEKNSLIACVGLSNPALSTNLCG